MLVRKRRLNLPVGPLAWTEQALRLPGTQLLPLSPAVVVRAVELPEDLNWDPSDRFLVAAAESENLRLVTRDRDILRFAAKYSIPFLNAREKVHAE
jgi:PIN domain nuclease of toxin-antitoxin system